MNLRARLARLERNRPAGGAGLDMSHLDQATLDAMAKAYAETLTSPGPDWNDATFAGLLAHIETKKAQGLGVADLTDGELELIVAAGDMARGQA